METLVESDLPTSRHVWIHREVGVGAGAHVGAFGGVDENVIDEQEITVRFNLIAGAYSNETAHGILLKEV